MQGLDVDVNGPTGGNGGGGGEGRGGGGEGPRLSLDSLTRSQKDGEIINSWCPSVFFFSFFKDDLEQCFFF